MELRDIIRDTKQHIKDISETIVTDRELRNKAKVEQKQLREELKKHEVQVWMGAVPEQPKKDQLQRAIYAKHQECSSWHQRKLDHRPEARHLMLAYAFMRGKVYKDIERSCKEEPSVDRVWSAMPGVSQVREPSIHKDMVRLWLKGEFVLAKPVKPEPVAAVA